MTMDISDMLLGLAILWPLLLAIPMFHSRLPWPRFLAILPAVILVLLPGDTFIQLNWLFFGTELSLNTDTRWILGMTVILWLTAATLFKSGHSQISSPQTSFFLMTLSGNLGVILASDLITFFSFSTLMGYSFYALMVQKQNLPGRQAGYWYIIFLILADLALFEAMLLAASTSGDLRYDLVHQAMIGTYASFYVWMVVIGFAFKAAIWPCYFWLSAATKSASQISVMLLGGVPIAMGLLGLLRWLPLGEHPFTIAGIVFVLLGTAAILHAAFRIFTQGIAPLFSVWLTITATGLFCIALGSILVYPSLWQTYENFAHPYIALLGIVLAILSLMTEKFLRNHKPASVMPRYTQTIYQLYKNKLSAIQQQTSSAFKNFESKFNTAFLSITEQCRNYSSNQKLELLLAGWKAKITLFVLLGLVFALLAR